MRKTFFTLTLILLLTKPLHAELFVGTGGWSGNVANPAFLVDEMNGNATQAFTGIPVWGTVYDLPTNRVLFTTSGISPLDGAVLMEWTPGGGTPTQVGVITFNDDPIRIDGLAIIGTQLYGAHQFDEFPGGSGIYSIDMSTLEATFITSFPSGSISGIEADPISGNLYGVNDDSATLDLIDLSTGVLTPVTNYPAPETDIDGLAVYNGIAYLVPDEPSQIYVYNINTSGYETPLPSPWTGTDTFSGAAFIYSAIAPANIPTLSEVGQILMILLIAASGTLVIIQRRATSTN